LKLTYTRQEVKEIEEKSYFTDEEKQILEYWLLDYSIVEMSDKMKLSTSTVSRRKKSILNKIKSLK
jgi:DNA-binding CsgD family transcriptional regulator